MPLPKLHDSQLDGPGNRDHHRGAVLVASNTRRKIFLWQHVPGDLAGDWRDTIGLRFGASHWTRGATRACGISAASTASATTNGTARGNPHGTCVAGRTINHGATTNSVFGSGAIDAMATTQARSSGLFSGLVLITVGLLILLRNYGHLDLHHFFTHWWPLLIIFWGIIKLYERTAGRRFGGGGGSISGSEVLLVFGMFALLGAVVAVDIIKGKAGEFGIDIDDMGGDNYSFDDLVIPPQTIPAGARVNVRVGHGDVTLRSSDDQELRVTANKKIKTWSEKEAGHIAQTVKVVIVKNGDAYEVHPDGFEISDARVDIDMEITIPKKSPVNVKADKGDVTISDQTADIDVTVQNGDVEIRDTKADVAVETRKGDVKVSDTTGNVKVSGKGGEVEVVNASGSFTLDGDFYGPVRADKIVKGIRLITVKTDLTLSSLSGHLEAGSGNLDIVNAPGNLTVRTRDTEVSLENPGGKVNIDNRNASVNVRFTSAPKDDVSISNSSSEIVLTVPGSSSFSVDANCNRCDIDSEFSTLMATKSAAGDSVLAGKLGSGRGPKIVLKTSYGNIALRRTSVSIPEKAERPERPEAPETPETDQ
jgi:hypothetical protein